MAARVYFETSAWNSLNRRRPAERDRLIQALRDSGDEIFASVITAGEILRTDDSEKRKALCDAMIRIHGEIRPLLDQPEHLARYVAEDFLRGERTFRLRESSGAARIRSYLEDPASVSPDDRGQVEAWVLAIDEDHLAVFRDLENVGPRLGPKFHSPETLERDDFNQLFIDKLPQVAELGLSVERLKELAAASDVWKAFSGGLLRFLDEARRRRLRPRIAAAPFQDPR
jgi:predicted nucleic acid-binding protein